MKQEIESGPAKLDADGQSVADTKAELDKEKEELDAKAGELSVYEDIAEKVERSREGSSTRAMVRQSAQRPSF